MKILILFIIIFLHIFDDFYLQGILTQMKQWNWWEKQYTGSLANKDKQRKIYGKDYLCALFAHAFSWSFITHLPWLIMSIANPALVLFYVISMITNMLFHAFVDDLKANKKWINLWIDQGLHLIQIVVTCFWWWNL